VVEILVKHFPDFDGESIQVQPSRTGKYHSLTAQLRFEELGKEDWAYKVNSTHPWEIPSRYGDEEGYVNYKFYPKT
jgi:putative lipoic acid-binding regulatory protein